MENCTILAELLYIISNHEKGRVSTKKIWSKKYINSLQSSFEMMLCILELMKKSNSIQHTGVQPIIDFVDRHAGTIFSEETSKKISIAYDEGKLFSCSKYDSKFEVVQLMEDIINMCNMAIRQKKRKYKKRLFYLLMALHNIPRAFLNSDNSPFFDIKVLPLSIDDVRMLCNRYIKLSQDL